MMHKFKVGDFIQIDKKYKGTMTGWARKFAEENIVFEVEQINSNFYLSRHPNGEKYGIALIHAIPASNNLVSQIKNESTKI